VSAEQRRFAEVLPLALGDTLRELEAEVIVMLLRSLPPQYPLNGRDQDDVRAFAAGRRSYQSCYPALWKAAISVLAMAIGEGGPGGDQARVLITKLLQHDDWARAAARNGLSGQAQVVAALRRVFAAWPSV
jgi:tRNA(Met) C34 N-acetyltransferase TmcA